MVSWFEVVCVLLRSCETGTSHNCSFRRHIQKKKLLLKKKLSSSCSHTREKRKCLWEDLFFDNAEARAWKLCCYFSELLKWEAVQTKGERKSSSPLLYPMMIFFFFLLTHTWKNNYSEKCVLLSCPKPALDDDFLLSPALPELLFATSLQG